MSNNKDINLNLQIRFKIEWLPDDKIKNIERLSFPISANSKYKKEFQFPELLTEKDTLHQIIGYFNLPICCNCYLKEMKDDIPSENENYYSPDWNLLKPLAGQFLGRNLEILKPQYIEATKTLVFSFQHIADNEVKKYGIRYKLLDENKKKLFVTTNLEKAQKYYQVHYKK